MSLPNTTILKRLMAIGLCLLALNVYVVLTPRPVFAADCTCSNCGECVKGQRCVCLYEGTTCTGGQWSDDNQCKCKSNC